MHLGPIRRITFHEHKFKRTGTYKCQCGARYTRTSSDYWTENPFIDWRGREQELNAKCKASVDEGLKGQPCTKCDRNNDPVKVGPYMG